MAKRTETFTFDDAEYPALARWLDNLPGRGKSKAIRESLSSYLAHDVSLDDVYQEVREIRRMLEAGALVVASGENHAGDEPGEPADVAAALDNLGL